MTDQAIINLRTVGVERARRGAKRSERLADLKAAFAINDDESPTPERVRKGQTFQAPAKDQKHDRPAYRALSAAAVLLQREEIEKEHYEAAEKFYKHLLGSMGVDVRWGDGSPKDSVEFRRSYHAQKVAEAKEHLTPREYMIIERLVADESTPVSVGFGLSGYVRQDAARPYGVSAINSALDRLSYFWGFKRREPPSR